MKKLRPFLGRVPKIMKNNPQVVPVVHPGSYPKAFSPFLAEAFSLICFVGGEVVNDLSKIKINIHFGVLQEHSIFVSNAS